MRCSRTSTLPSRVERVARVRAPRVGARGTLEAARVVGVEEGVVALRVGAELRVVALRRERQWSAALPAPDHLRAEQRLLLAARGLRAEVLPVGRHLRVQLAEHDVGAVAAEHLGRRHRRQLAGLVRVAEDDLAGLERPLLRVRWRPAAALDRRLADPVLEAEGRAPGRELVAVLAPDHLDARELLLGLASLLDHGLRAAPRRGRGPPGRRGRRSCRAAAPSAPGCSRRRLPAAPRGPPSPRGTPARSCRASSAAPRAPAGRNT